MSLFQDFKTFLIVIVECENNEMFLGKSTKCQQGTEYTSRMNQMCCPKIKRFDWFGILNHESFKPHLSLEFMLIWIKFLYINSMVRLKLISCNNISVLCHMSQNLIRVLAF